MIRITLFQKRSGYLEPPEGSSFLQVSEEKIGIEKFYVQHILRIKLQRHQNKATI